MRVTTTLACAALLLAVSQAALIAAEPGQTGMAKVGYADLDIATDAGEAALMARVYRATEDVCGGVPVDQTLAVKQSFRNCRRVALDNALPQVHAALDRAHDKAHVEIHEAFNDR